MESVKLLVAQDAKSIFDLFKMMAEDKGVPFDMDWVGDGQQAVDRIQAGKDYDAMLMNIEMPRMDGIAATKEIRKLGYKKPIVAWSGYSRDWKWEACKAAGMDEYVSTWEPNLNLMESVLVRLWMVGVLDRWQRN